MKSDAAPPPEAPLAPYRAPQKPAPPRWRADRPRRCPHCDRLGPSTTERCDCGYDFPSGQLEPSRSSALRRREGPTPWQGVGLFFLFCTALLTLINLVGSLTG